MIKILINSNEIEKRIAILENNNLVEYYVEKIGEANLIGNIYKGKVVKILPGMQAAFVDIGIGRAGFLYVGDISCLGSSSHIEDILKHGQDILVQIVKEPIGSKGVRLTANLTIPGKYLVLLPTLSHIGVSKKIEDESERERLKECLNKLNKETNLGFIARTASEGVTFELLEEDKDFLLKIWDKIKKKYESSKAPKLLYKELGLIFRIIRDFYSLDVEEIIVNNRDDYNELKNFIESYLPKFKNKLVFYSNSEPLFEKYNIEHDISKIFKRKIWLKSGGYITIDKTEALTAIDVNTGRFVGEKELEETVFQTNVEAAKEIAYQIRLRNIGGLIVIDFIDMNKKEYREKVYEILENEFKKDRSKVKIQKISELGIVEMTRKRTQEDITTTLVSPCPVCEGKGYIKSPSTICAEIYRTILKRVHYLKNKKINLVINPMMAEKIMEEEKEIIDLLENNFDLNIQIEASPTIPVESFEIEVF